MTARGLILALVGFLVVGVSVGATATGPPVIREPFTVLPCPKKPQSTVEIEGCLERSLLRSDRRINTRARAIYRALGSKNARADFVAGERSWLAYRRRSCRAQASVYSGGSAEPVAYLSCEVGRNKRHLADLAATEREVRRR